jgi:RimJ/RimL family protein N-acetyltransferase
MGEVVELRGERIVIRPLRRDELDAWLAGRADLGREALPAGLQERERLRERIERSGTLRHGEIDLAIEVGGRLAGQIQAYRPPSRTLPEGVYEIGVALFDSADRGKGLGTEAVRLFVDWLFEQGGEHVQGGTAVTNHPMRRVFERLGFRVIGRLDVDGLEELLYGVKKAEWATGRTSN